MRWGSTPKFLAASRMAAKSTTTGTPVKSWRRTREAMNGISFSGRFVGVQRARASTSLFGDQPSVFHAQQVFQKNADGVGEFFHRMPDLDSRERERENKETPSWSTRGRCPKTVQGFSDGGDLR
jgi:hypothetical protein